MTKNWRVNAAISLCLALSSLITTIFWLPESFRFLYGKKNFEKARIVLNKAASYNKSKFDFLSARFQAEVSPDHESAMNATDTSIEPAVSKEATEAVTNELKLTGSLKELFSTPVFRRNLIIMVIIWSFCAFAFFLVPFYLSALDEQNMFLMSLAIAIAEIISSVICLVFIEGRDLRKQLSLYYFLTCLGAVSIMLFNWIYTGPSEVPTAIGFLLLYVGVVTAFDLVYLIVNQLFPTIYLATSYGACNIVGRAITILSPLVA